MELGAVADELYAGRLEDFTPQRTARAKAARADGDKALAAVVGKLRKPSRSAWAINMLTRSSTAEVERLLELGAAFRQAQDDLDGAELRELTRQRQTLIAAVVEQVRTTAGELGQSISDAIATEVEQTFRAAMADPDAAAAVRGGALTTAISGSGLGSLKISDVAASTTPVLELVPAPAPTRRRGRKAAEPKGEDPDDENTAARQEHERAAKAAADRVERAERAAAVSTEQLTAAGQAAELAGTRRDELRAALEGLRERLAATEEALRAAEESLADAEQDRAAAKAAAAGADQALDDARGASSG
ncbi:MAG: hypothetical protein M3Q84_07960 [Actinomycetota bacterium]|nr:hypothetical protein [Actinomycetota bacterium]